MHSPNARPSLPVDPEPDAPDHSLLASSRTRFWLGFGIGFLALMLFSCGGAFFLFGPGDFSLADLQGGQGAWTPPTAAPTPEQMVDATSGRAGDEGATGGLFSIGQQAQNVTNSRVNVRRTPGYQGKPDDDAVAQLRPGDRVEIIGAPMLEDGLIWWRVRYSHPDGRVIEGWVAQATASGVTILAAAQP